MMNAVMPILGLNTIEKLRVAHQTQARRAAESGEVPQQFINDPTFAELVESYASDSAD